MDSAVAGLVGTLLGGLIAAVPTWFRAAKEDRRRTWDQRREAYVHLLGELTEAELFLSRLRSVCSWSDSADKYKAVLELRQAAPAYARRATAACHSALLLEDRRPAIDLIVKLMTRFNTRVNEAVAEPTAVPSAAAEVDTNPAGALMAWLMANR